MDTIDCLVSVIRSFDSSKHLSLKLLETITFSNLYINLLTFACCQICLDAKVKTNLLSILLLFFKILFVDEARHFQIVAISFLDKVCICKFINILQLVSSSN